MKYSSEKFTRSVILFMVGTSRIPEARLSVERGSLSSADFKDKENYFKFGAGIFMLMGFVVILFSIIGVVLTIVFHGLLGALFFFYYAPGLMLYCIGVTLSMKEKSSAKNITDSFQTKSLILSCVSGVLGALFITSFSVMNFMEAMNN